MYAVIGLGNPGKKYNYTKHNVGFDAIDCLAQRNNVKVIKIKHQAIYGEFNLSGEKVILVKPQTYMNNSGVSVKSLVEYYKIPIKNIIVLYDDIDIDIGSLRIRKKGSAGSHNGMRSIIYHLKDDNFPRVRIGIGKPQENRDLVDHVLGGFNKEDREKVDDIILKAAKSVEEIIKTDIDKAMNMYNG
ncbi:aminoacyl-tRNA hydrolase [Clostridium sp. D2Q-11]|uniref:Peptidyl-tRNA hydrolase n=1 Tax=Anaeromonas frigoriresistens TaxID=2683708 RepID=A0A942Z848_9FIRM|nr:aminoacyl-tRNA hydrolase [Anaeromonas frigoriresistens]MBS4537594.1 aminoacyl-tRNA hydrolase [Anaeromonas frigoriresistens]